MQKYLFLAFILLVTWPLTGSAGPRVEPIARQANVGACTLSVLDPYGGRFREHPDNFPPTALYSAGLHRASIPDAINLNFVCQNGQIHDICPKYAGVSFQNDRWSVTPDEDGSQRDTDENILLVELGPPGTKGAAVLWSDTTGEEDKRYRHLVFCVAAPSGNTLYGDAVVDVLRNPTGNHSSIQAEVLALLRSIRFVDVPGAAFDPVISETRR